MQLDCLMSCFPSGSTPDLSAQSDSDDSDDDEGNYVNVQDGPQTDWPQWAFQLPPTFVLPLPLTCDGVYLKLLNDWEKKLRMKNDKLFSFSVPEGSAEGTFLMQEEFVCFRICGVKNKKDSFAIERFQFYQASESRSTDPDP